MRPPEDAGGVFYCRSISWFWTEAHIIPEVATNRQGTTLVPMGLIVLTKTLYNPKSGKGILKRANSDSAKILTEKAIEAVKSFFTVVKENHLTVQNCARRLIKPQWGDSGSLYPLKQLIVELKDVEEAVDNGGPENRDQRYAIPNF